jgi:hypothetical protein
MDSAKDDSRHVVMELIVLGIIMLVCWLRGKRAGYAPGYMEGYKNGQRDIIIERGQVTDFRYKVKD